MPQTFETFIKPHISKVQMIAKSYANSGEYQDLSQDIFIQLWKGFESFRGDSQVKTWVYRVALNTAISYQRKKISEKKLGLIYGSAQRSECSVAELAVADLAVQDGQCQQRIIESFVKTLNKIDRAIFLMYLDGIVTADMEQVLGMKVNAIKVRISRMKTKFSQQFVD